MKIGDTAAMTSRTMRARRTATRAASLCAPSLVLVAATALGGCGHRDDYYYSRRGNTGRSFSLPTCPSASAAAKAVAIDTDATLMTDAGQGAGVLVEYMTGGHWHIWTVCDTSISGYSCNYDITGQAIGAKVSNILGEQLESDDVATSYCSDTAILGTTTRVEFDGIWFDTTPGASVRVTAALGQALYETLFYWKSGGVVHDDANANPVEFTPSAP
jgi:hypothetical protein